MIVGTNNSTTSTYSDISRKNYAEAIVKGFFILCSIYLLVVTSIFLQRTRKKQKLHLKSESFAKNYAFASVIVLLLISIFALVRNVTYGAGIYWNIQTTSWNMTSSGTLKAANVGCAVTTGVGDLSLTIGVGLVYLFLWIRQRIFYVHPALKSLTNKYVSVTSNIILVVWALYYIFILVVFIGFIRFEFDVKSGGCVVKTGTTKLWFRVIIISWTVSSILMQFVLLGLFVYPLLKQATWQKENDVNGSHLLVRVKKAVGLTSISLLSDTVAFLLPSVFDYGLTIAYNINLIINTFVVIGYFDCWKTVLLPCKKDSSAFDNNKSSSDSIEVV